MWADVLVSNNMDVSRAFDEQQLEAKKQSHNGRYTKLEVWRDLLQLKLSVVKADIPASLAMSDLVLHSMPGRTLGKRTLVPGYWFTGGDWLTWTAVDAE